VRPASCRSPAGTAAPTSPGSPADSGLRSGQAETNTSEPDESRQPRSPQSKERRRDCRAHCVGRSTSVGNNENTALRAESLPQHIDPRHDRAHLRQCAIEPTVLGSSARGGIAQRGTTAALQQPSQDVMPPTMTVHGRWCASQIVGSARAVQAPHPHHSETTRNVSKVARSRCPAVTNMPTGSRHLAHQPR
jgi:hypothetical protein